MQKSRIAVLAILALALLGAAFASAPSIAAEEVRSIALSDAGLAEADVLWLKLAWEREDGRERYDAEFLAGDTVYEYEIDAATGAILKREQEIAERDDLLIAEALRDTSGKYVGEEQALSAALTLANATSESIEHPSVWLSQDDGRLVYEVRWYEGRLEREFEVDALTGEAYPDN